MIITKTIIITGRIVIKDIKEAVSKVVMSNLSLILVSAPTTKAVGSEYVIKIGTDGFSRRTTKNKS